MGTNCGAIIEDYASANRALGRLLRGAGFEPSGFESAESFLADPARPTFGCLLVDIQLTGMSGLELQRRLQSEGSRVPVIFITAHEDPGSRAEAQNAGALAFFTKPFPGRNLLDAISLAIRSGSGEGVAG